MKIPVKWLVFDASFDACFFVRLTGRSFGVCCITVNPSLRKGPAPAARTNLQEFGFAVFQAIANCRNMNAFACGFSVDIFPPPQDAFAFSVNRTGYRRHPFPSGSMRVLLAVC